MKKIISLMLVAVLMLGTFTSCADKSNNQGDNGNLTATLSEIADEIVEKNPDGVQGEKVELDLKDKSKEGQWLIESNLGLKDVSKIKEALVYESAMGSTAFSMVLVRVNKAADAKDVANEMKENIDPRKWVCVSADDVQVVGYGDVIMFIMLDSGLNLNTQSYVDAFKEICGGKLDF